MYQGINGNVPKFTRTSSQICPTPEEELLEAVQKNYSNKIQQLLIHNRKILEYVYPDYQKPILLIACSSEGIEAETVEILLNFGANPKYYTEDDQRIALHYAAQETDFNILNVLLRRNPREQINDVDHNGSNALQILIRYSKKERNSEDFQKCVQLLIDKGINVANTDCRNYTALYWAEKKGVSQDIIRIIQSANEALVSVNQQKYTNNNFEDEFERLMDFLKQKKEEEFIQYRNGDIKDLVDYSDNSTLLQFSVERGFYKAAKHLLEQGADPDRCGNKNFTKPIITAAIRGFGDIFELLLNKYEVAKLPPGLLPIITVYIDDESHGNKKCYDAYIRKVKNATPDERSLKLNEVNENSNTALHYAIRYADSKISEELLSLGASLGSKNVDGIMPIQDIDSDLLRRHLDNCISFDTNKQGLHKQSFQVTFNYSSLIPPYVTERPKKNFMDLEAVGMNKSNIQREFVAETEVISFISTSSEHKHLLKHPVLVSFLFIKWLQIQWLFWTNLAFYITFFLSLVVYIFSDYANFSDKEKSSFTVLLANLSYVCLGLTLIILICRELFQVFVAHKKYFKNLENYVEVILIVITAMIVCIDNPSFDLRKQLSSISILLSAFELLLMLGQHPYFSTNVVMLKTVSFNFFKFLIWYSLLIVAFALSFYLLFTPNVPKLDSGTDITITNSTEKESDDDESFANPGRSVFKTIIMLTGEFDASSINFEKFPIISKLMFALFIFMIAIILLNLLNGLAVSDTQLIKNDAELVGYVARAQYIRYVESMLIGNILPMNILNKVKEVCCCLPETKNLKPTFRKYLAKKSCLFPNLNYELTFYPNKSGEIDVSKFKKQGEINKNCTPCAVIRLDRNTVRRTNEIVMAKIEEENERKNQGNDENYIRRLEKEIASLKTKMDEILTLLSTPNSVLLK
ncbi:hypothetical protein ABEB36_005690 [Hypothenemus hampei]|uniref:Ion transport domain-containing protein n=1 Tax=Hypothenemus hampei TaxID=57062 RepID=A0ABD1F1R2_HYPHA